MTTRRLTTQLSALGTLIADRWPDRIEHRLVVQLVATLPRSLEHMATITADGHPTSTPGAPDRGNGARGESELTSVESAVESRLRLADPERSPTEAYVAMRAAVVAAALAVAEDDRTETRRQLRTAQRLVDTWQPPVVIQPTAHRCTPAGEEALEAWVRPDCEANAVRSGLCSACYQRRRYHHQQRSEGAA